MATFNRGKREGGMFEWVKGRRSTVASRPQPDEPILQRPTMTGKYLSLYTYLEKRYADTVVLTFAQIESLLGFTLPDPARLREEWWTNPEAGTTRPCYSDSWILAGRTARPNLRALTVVFDRAS